MKTEDLEPERAKLGETFTTRHSFTGHAVEMTVVPSCGGKAGVWYCIPHDETFRNNFEKDFHLSQRRRKKDVCRLAWVCPLHGPEVP